MGMDIVMHVAFWISSQESVRAKSRACHFRVSTARLPGSRRSSVPMSRNRSHVRTILSARCHVSRTIEAYQVRSVVAVFCLELGVKDLKST